MCSSGERGPDLLPVGPGDPEDPSICKLMILFIQSRISQPVVGHNILFPLKREQKEKENSQPKRFPDKPTPILRRDLGPIHEILDLHIHSVVLAHLALDLVELAGVGVFDVERVHLAARVERVEADLAAALPLGHVDLGRPRINPGKPKRRPCAYIGRCLELSREVVARPRSGLYGEGLLGVHGPRQVLDLDGLAPRGCRRLAGNGLGRDGQRRVARQRDVGLVHARGAVVVRAPWVQVVPVGVEGGLGVEGGGGDDGALGDDGC